MTKVKHGCKTLRVDSSASMGNAVSEITGPEIPGPVGGCVDAREFDSIHRGGECERSVDECHSGECDSVNLSVVA